MEVVIPDTGDMGVQKVNTAFSVVPIVAELDRKAHSLSHFS